MRLVWGFLLFLAALGASHEVRAAAPDATVRLVYARGGGADQCPDEDSLRADVAGHLGYDPFRTDAPRTLFASISRAGQGLRGDIVIRSSVGTVLGKRELASHATDCSELASALALAMSIAIDPLQLVRPYSSPSPSGASVETPIVQVVPVSVVPEAAEHPEKAPSRADPVTWRIALGAGGALGAEPGPSFDTTLEGGLRWRKASFALEGRIDLPASLQAGNGTGVRASRFAGTFVPCLHESVVLLCGLATLGVLQGTGLGVVGQDKDTTAFATAGARLGLELPVYGVLAARFAVDGAAALTRTSLAVGGKDLWTTPALLGGFGVAAVGRFR
jgi:hypothetical protein